LQLSFLDCSLLLFHVEGHIRSPSSVCRLSHDHLLETKQHRPMFFIICCVINCMCIVTLEHHTEVDTTDSVAAACRYSTRRSIRSSEIFWFCIKMCSNDVSTASCLTLASDHSYRQQSVTVVMLQVLLLLLLLFVCCCCCKAHSINKKETHKRKTQTRIKRCKYINILTMY